MTRFAPEAKRVYLLTGRPGSGKTTLLREVVAQTRLKAGGFYTEEIRIQGVRQGFQIVTLDGNSTILAHVDLHSSYHVSKYGVNLKELERVAIPAIRQAIRWRDLIVIDEIGKMELILPSFRKVVEEALESEKPVLGTIMLKPHPWADELKRHPAVRVILVNRGNHAQVAHQVSEWLRSWRGSSSE